MQQFHFSLGAAHNILHICDALPQAIVAVARREVGQKLLPESFSSICGGPTPAVSRRIGVLLQPAGVIGCHTVSRVVSLVKIETIHLSEILCNGLGNLHMTLKHKALQTLPYCDNIGQNRRVGASGEKLDQWGWQLGCCATSIPSSSNTATTLRDEGTRVRKRTRPRTARRPSGCEAAVAAFVVVVVVAAVIGACHPENCLLSISSSRSSNALLGCSV
ncbi:hypothetical protein DQ04_14701000 [Trypanosoma grayi]|uniref:hypothetical protein n=1 Tax=Trypanosoma grayi TaxID=71804 RepID=UPI0004F44BCB|nr:hypothetical protein DQ04_14701000 [Trypanosoma grayi]KEG06306.1 hypothetical protein DQ04_14701000 [Trypanosoma grayi]